MQTYESNIEYLESWSDELLSRANRIRHLIGSKHWLTDGHHKEAIIREFLKRYLPKSLEVSTGFIKCNKKNTCSPEIDILISDWSKHPCYLNEGGVQIVAPSSCVGYIEVKTRFTSTNFKKALACIYGSQLLVENETVWRCIVFVEIEESFNSYCDKLRFYVEELIKSKNVNTSQHAVNILPNCITSFGSFVAFIKKSGDSLAINIFDFAKASPAVSFCDFFEHVRYCYGGKGSGDMADIVESLPHNNFRKEMIRFGDD